MEGVSASALGHSTRKKLPKKEHPLHRRQDPRRKTFCTCQALKCDCVILQPPSLQPSCYRGWKWSMVKRNIISMTILKKNIVFMVVSTNKKTLQDKNKKGKEKRKKKKRQYKPVHNTAALLFLSHNICKQ
jgi:hypothetical protein